jgi:uncharacterized repeat protein (TIGR04076 family)
MDGGICSFISASLYSCKNIDVNLCYSAINRTASMAQCKITVVKKTLNSDLAKKNIIMDVGRCELFNEGDVFIVDDELGKPDNFCSWAWNDIFKTVVTLARGGNFNEGMFKGWMKDGHSMITCCTDGIRPVIFKIERIEN